MADVPLNTDLPRLHRIAQLMRHLGNTVRFQMVQFLVEEGPKHVNEIHQQLAISQSSASQHLKALEQLHLLQSQRVGPRVEYSIQQKEVINLLNCARTAVAHLPEASKIKYIGKMLKTMGHPDRLLLVELLLNRGKKRVTEIYQQLAISQSSTSQHLKALEHLGIVDVEQEGKSRYYFVIHPHVQHMIHCVGNCAIC